MTSPMTCQRTSLDIGCRWLIVASSIFATRSLSPCPVTATVGTIGTPNSSSSFGMSIRIPLCLASSTMLSATTTGILCSSTCIAMTRFLSRAVASMTSMTTSAPSFKIRRAIISASLVGSSVYAPGTSISLAVLPPYLIVPSVKPTVVPG